MVSPKEIHYYYFKIQCNLPIATPLSWDNLQITSQSFDLRFFLLYIISIKNFSITTKPRVKPLFCNIDEQGNKTSLSMRCPAGACQRHIFSLYFPTNESMCLLNTCVLNLASRQSSLANRNTSILANQIDRSIYDGPKLG